MSETIKQIKDRYKIDLECQGIKYELWRIDDTEYTKFRKDNSVAIENDCNFSGQLYLSEQYREDNNLNLAEFFTVLEYLLGESSNSYDDYRGSFKFHNLLVIKREDSIFFYLINISDHRGFMQFDLYKIVENTEKNKYDDLRSYKPFASELSKKEINYLFSYLYGFLIEYFNNMKSVIPRQNFLKKVDCNFILYGCKDGEYFEYEYDSEEFYKAQIKLFKETYKIPLDEVDISAALQKITHLP